MRNTVRIGARTAAEALAHFSRVPGGTVYRMEVVEGELERLVGGHLIGGEAFRPLREGGG